MRTVRPIGILLLVFLVGGTLADTQAGRPRGWTTLGSRTVSDRVDHDTIQVSGNRGTFSALRLQVSRHDVQFRSMKIRYGDGEVQEIDLRVVIPAGGASRVIDLPGGRRVIRKVSFVYDAQAFRGRTATVRLFGRR